MIQQCQSWLATASSLLFPSQAGTRSLFMHDFFAVDVEITNPQLVAIYAGKFDAHL